jgi:hypothetical protein
LGRREVNREVVPMLTASWLTFIICSLNFNLWPYNVLIDLGCYTAGLDRP